MSSTKTKELLTFNTRGRNVVSVCLSSARFSLAIPGVPNSVKNEHEVVYTMKN